MASSLVVPFKKALNPMGQTGNDTMSSPLVYGVWSISRLAADQCAHSHE